MHMRMTSTGRIASEEEFIVRSGLEKMVVDVIRPIRTLPKERI